MLAAHLIIFLKQHQQPSSEEFEQAIEDLCDAMLTGSSCLNLHHQPSTVKALAVDEANSVVASPGNYAPLIYAYQRLYLQKYYHYESIVFSILNHFSHLPSSDLTPNTIALAEHHFGTIDGNDQAAAAICALTRALTIITGGPGTGKTTTVLKILHLLANQEVFSHPSEVVILAPTGKAADRLRQSILSGIERLKLHGQALPTETSTIHRALGYLPRSSRFRHDAESPLLAKVVIVDESSMVDLPLMAKFLQAVPADAKLILLGDKHQLSSVEVGSVLADLIAADGYSSHPIKKNIINLRKSYRTVGDIHRCCEAIKHGDFTAINTIAAQSKPNEIGSVSVLPLPTSLITQLQPFVEKHWLPVLLSDAPAQEKLATIDCFRILCPTHHGPFGIHAINQAVEHILQSHGLDTSQLWYHGRSVIIQKNELSLNIFNGDTGLCLYDGEHAAVHFYAGEEEKKCAPILLPEVKTAWALTIHKTQGSEYEHILIILPETQGEHQLMSRELLYTALSRAKQSATIWSEQATLQNAIASQAKRASGLTERFTSNSDLSSPPQ